MLDHWRQDLARMREAKGTPFPAWLLDALLFESGFQAVTFYRVARWFKARGIPVLGPLFARLGLFFTGVDISPNADIGPGLRISHGLGMVIGGAARIGARAHILHGVTLGARSRARLEEMPVIGDDVYIGAGACLIGAVKVGNGVHIGAYAIVTEDIPDGYRVAPVPGLRLIPPRVEGPAA